MYIIFFLLLIILIIFFVINKFLDNYSYNELFRNNKKIKYLKKKKIINTNIDTDINTKIIIVNIYQEKYVNGNCCGIGDFIRGSYFLLQYCDKLNLECEINILNHPISKFLNNSINPTILNNIKIIICSNFMKIDKNNNVYISYSNNPEKYIKDFKDNILDIKPINNKIHILTNYFPINIISENHKNIIRNIFDPTDEMKNYIEKYINELKLTKKNYITIHIRCGDDILVHKKNISINLKKKYMIKSIL